MHQNSAKAFLNSLAILFLFKRGCYWGPPYQTQRCTARVKKAKNVVLLSDDQKFKTVENALFDNDSQKAAVFTCLLNHRCCVSMPKCTLWSSSEAQCQKEVLFCGFKWSKK